MKKILTLLSLCLLLFISATSIAQDVIPDSFFGQNGLVTTSTVKAFTCVAKQSDGKIVAAKGIDINFPKVSSFVVVRFNVDGTLDNSFGTNGRAEIPFELFGSGSQPTSYPVYADAYSIAVNKDGQIAVAGRVYYDQGWFTGFGFAVAIFNPDGTPVNGKATARPKLAVTNIGGTSITDMRAESVAVQKDGKFVVAGERQLLSNSGGSVLGTVYLVVRYSLNGAEEKVVETFVPGPLGVKIHANSIAVQDEGKILVVGEAYSSGRELVRYNSDLTLDNSFNKTGSLYIPFLTTISDQNPGSISYSADHTIAVQNDGKILAVGRNTSGLALVRFKPDGTLDNTFGVGGIVSIGLPAAATSVSILDNGKIMISGGDGSNLQLIRVNENGTLDDSFGVGGKVTKSAGFGIINTLITSDHFYVVGSAQNNGAIAAFMLGNVCTPPTFLNNGSIVLDASCFGNDGNISIIPLSGKAPFQYSIDNGATYVEGSDRGYTFMGLAAGQYKLRLKDANGCESAAITREVKPNVYGPCATLLVKSAGLHSSNENNALAVRTYPNPSKGQFKVQLNGFASTKVQLQVLDAKGSVIQTRNVNASEGNIIDVNLQGKAKGLYFVRLVSDKGVQIQKVTLQ